MPAITSLTISAAAPLGRVLSVLAGRARRALKQLAEKVKSRRDAMRLAELDDRMLADIGLSRGDLRDAFAVAAVARPGRLAGAARCRAARQQAADEIKLRAGDNRFRGAVRDDACTLLSAELIFGRIVLADPPIGQPSGAAVSPPVLRMLRPPPPGGRILFVGSVPPTARLETPASLYNAAGDRSERRRHRCVSSSPCSCWSRSPSFRRARKPDLTGRAATMPASWCRPAIRRSARRAATAMRAAGPGPFPTQARPRSAAALPRHAG